MIEAIVYFVICSCIFPANVVTIYKFYHKDINKIFFTLITSFCVTNMAFACFGYFDAIAKVSNSHPLGWSGCAISFCGGCTILNITMVIQALISYERRKVITSVSMATFKSQIFISLPFFISIITGFWIFIYKYFVIIQFVQIKLDNNSTIEVCVAESRVFPGFLELVFAIAELLIPGCVITYNYL